MPWKETDVMKERLRDARMGTDGLRALRFAA